MQRRGVAALWLMAIPACWASEISCQKVEYVYPETTPCAKALAAATPKGGFTVSRCAGTKDEVEEFLKKKDRLVKHSADTCKLAWLAGCATFPLPDVVVVPKRIVCNNVICDQSSYYSNCFEDGDCNGVNSVEEGLPKAGYMWPMAGNHSDMKKQYRPCCDFYELNCNGAFGPSTRGEGEEESMTPSERARKHGLCAMDDGTGSSCWSKKHKA